MTPVDRAGRVACPFCESTDNELFSVFGQTLIGTQYYCNNCRTVFEAVRWEDQDPDEDGLQEGGPEDGEQTEEEDNDGL